MFDKTAQLYDLIYSSKDYERESRQIHDYIKTLHAQANTILDVACGTGKHASYLGRTLKVDGIDLNERFVEIASKRNPGGAFFCKDMTSFQLNKRYDVVMCLFSAIAYVRTNELLIKTLDEFKHHLKDDGIVIVEPWFAPESWETGRVDIVNAEDDKGHKVCRMSHSATEGTMSILNFQYLIGSSIGVEHYTERHELGLFTVEDMLGAFEGAGLVCEYDPIGISGRGIYIGKMPS